MSIDIEVKGEPDDARALATWLRESLAAGWERAASATVQARAAADRGWDGLAAAAYDGVAKQLVGAADDREADARLAAEALDAFAAELERQQSVFDRFEQMALEGDLIVRGDEIARPNDVAAYADVMRHPPTDAEEAAAVAERQARMRLYESLQDAVRADREFHQRWIETNLGAVAKEVGGGEMLDRLTGPALPEPVVTLAKNTVDEVGGRTLGIATETWKGLNLIKDLGLAGAESIVEGNTDPLKEGAFGEGFKQVAGGLTEELVKATPARTAVTILGGTVIDELTGEAYDDDEEAEARTQAEAERDAVQRLRTEAEAPRSPLEGIYVVGEG